MRCGLRDGGAATCRNTRGLDHRVATGIALAREGAFDAEHAERFADPRVVELAATFGMEKSAADVFLETVTQPFLGFLTAFYRAHPAKRPFDARMVVPVDVIVYQDEHLITGTLLPMLGIDGFRLHAPEESLRVVNRTPIVGLKKFRFDDRRCDSFVCVRIEGDTTTTGSGARR